MNIIGTCSICGGAVSVPRVWMGIIPPTPRCGGCGAMAAAHGPVIPMQPQPLQPRSWGTQQAAPSPWSPQMDSMWRNGAEAMVAAQGGWDG